MMLNTKYKRHESCGSIKKVFESCFFETIFLDPWHIYDTSGTTLYFNNNASVSHKNHSCAVLSIYLGQAVEEKNLFEDYPTQFNVNLCP